MTPVYEQEEQRKLRERIQQTQPDWVLLWWDIATVTGWRTSDVCNFRYSCINWETGIATIIVAKQTKAAEARATRKDRDCSPAAQGRRPACWRSHCLHALG